MSADGNDQKRFERAFRQAIEQVDAVCGTGNVNRPVEFYARVNARVGFSYSVRPWAWYETGDEHDDSYNREPQRGMKFCTKCGREKPLHYFHRDNRRRDGRRARCQACRSEAYRARTS